jgi:hypothetical protein
MEATDLDRLIERRSSSNPDPDTLEPSYAESVRRFNARQRDEHLWQRLLFHQAMLRSHRENFRQIIRRHKAGVSRCEEMLGIRAKQRKGNSMTIGGVG